MVSRSFLASKTIERDFEPALPGRPLYFKLPGMAQEALNACPPYTPCHLFLAHWVPASVPCSSSSKPSDSLLQDLCICFFPLPRDPHTTVPVSSFGTMGSLLGEALSFDTEASPNSKASPLFIAYHFYSIHSTYSTEIQFKQWIYLLTLCLLPLFTRLDFPVNKDIIIIPIVLFPVGAQ